MNTRYVIGVVVYTGHDSKIMLNSVKARPKKSELEVTMNYMIIIIFAIQMVTCLFGAVYNVFWEYEHESKLPYLQQKVNSKDH